MERGRKHRNGLTILELIICVAIAGILVAILLSIAGRARSRAAETAGANKLRQIALSVHAFAADHNGSLPGYEDASLNEGGFGVFALILPYLEVGHATPNPHGVPGFDYVPAFVSPEDRTFATAITFTTAQGGTGVVFGDHSYPANWQSFRTGRGLARSFPDGTSNTIAFAERFARCNRTGSLWSLPEVENRLPNGRILRWSNPLMRCPTFADANYDDVVPITENDTTRPSMAGTSFQLSPFDSECDYRVPQSPRSASMFICQIDGSVRSVTRSTTPELFWSLVTPSGNEAVVSP